VTQFTAYLRGTNFRPIEAKAFVNGLVGGETLTIMRESTNQYDSNAIMVLDPASEMHLGYVAKEVAAELAPLMDQGIEFRCVVESVAMRSVILQIEELEKYVDTYISDPNA
jgi:hypothetical protein